MEGPGARESEIWRELIVGLSLREMLRGRASAGQARPPGGSGFGAADSVVLVYLQGSPSHIDLWDPKPKAPAGIRGEFKPIETKTPGLYLGEVLPMLWSLRISGQR